MGMIHSSKCLIVLSVLLVLRLSAHAQATDSLTRQVRFAGITMTRPQKAGILSGIVPGAGQVYNRQYWKLPIVYGALASVTYVDIQYWRLYKEYKAGSIARKKYEQGSQNSIDTGPNSGKEPSNAIQNLRFRQYRTARDVWMGITVAVYGAQILEAVTASHLQGFDVSDTLTMHWQPCALSVSAAGITPGVLVVLNMHTRAAK